MGAVAREVYADVKGNRRPARRSDGTGARDPRLPEPPAAHAGLRDRAQVMDDGENVSLPPATEIQLVASCRRRSATFASMRRRLMSRSWWSRRREVELEIVDDGHGFDPLLRDPTRWPRLGLRRCGSEAGRSAVRSTSCRLRPRHAHRGTRAGVRDRGALVRCSSLTITLFRAGIASLLRAWGMDVVGQAADGIEAIDLTRAAQAGARADGRRDVTVQRARGDAGDQDRASRREGHHRHGLRGRPGPVRGGQERCRGVSL